MDTPSEDQNSSREEDVSVYWDDDDDLMRKSSMDDEEGDEATKRARATKIQQKLKLAEERHFVRRYQVALEFIKSSAKHLLVQEDNETLQKKLLPMLDDLLESNAKTNFKRKSSSTRDVVAQVLEDPEKHAQQTAQEMRKSTSGLFQLDWVQDNTQLQEYLEQMNSEAAYQCLCWLFFEHLLHATGGYDARIRYWFKSTAVTVWMQQFEEEPLSAKSFTQSYSKLARASRKFESLEHCIATRLLTLAANNKNVNAQAQTAAEKKQSSLAGNIWKGAQVAGVGVLVSAVINVGEVNGKCYPARLVSDAKRLIVKPFLLISNCQAGTLLAVTGGLAAPGIAAGLAALGMGAVAGTFLTLASSAAVVSLFGVATGGLAAYKMNRRVSGLSEFTIQQELIDKKNEGSDKKKGDAAPPPKAELFRTVAVSGWLNNGKADFQKPWGVTPSNPPISDKVELLQRFYQVHNHDLVAQAESIWNEYKEKPDVLWQFLGDKYGVDPDHIFDTDKEKPAELTLTTDEETTLDSIIVAIGNVESGDTSKQNKAASDKQEKDGNKQSSTKKEESKGDKKNRFSMKGLKKNILSKTANVMKSDSNDVTAPEGQPSPQAAHSQSRQGPFSSSPSSSSGSTFESVKSDKKSNKSFEPPAHLSTVWNYQKLYGGELYTVRWESDLLVEICDSVRDLALDLASKGGQQVLKYTIASTLMLAASLPITIMSVSTRSDSWKCCAVHSFFGLGLIQSNNKSFRKQGHGFYRWNLDFSYRKG